MSVPPDVCGRQERRPPKLELFKGVQEHEMQSDTTWLRCVMRAWDRGAMPTGRWAIVALKRANRNLAERRLVRRPGIFKTCKRRILEPRETPMKTIGMAAMLSLLVGAAASAQTLDDLKNDGKNTDNILTYGMGYGQNRYSPLRQIDKTNAKATVAIDVGTGRQIWKTPVDWLPETPRVVCCGVSNKGAAIYNGKIYRTTLDAYVVALDAKTGKEIWKSKAAEWREGYSMTVAPL